MKKIKLLYLKNQMLVSNSIANFIGVLLVKTLMLHIQETFAKDILESPIAHLTNALFSPFAFSFVTVMTFLYEKPIRQYLTLTLHKFLSSSLAVMSEIVAFPGRCWMLDTRCWISNRTLSVNFNDIQDPETRIQDQSIFSMVFIAAAKLDFKILCNYRVKCAIQT